MASSTITAARAIERLRHSVAPNETDRKKQWTRLGELLQLDKSYTKIIRETATGPRHGDPTHIPAVTVLVFSAFAGCPRITEDFFIMAPAHPSAGPPDDRQRSVS
jgi:hypothetical protein